MTAEELELERALLELLGEEVGVAAEFEAALDAGDLRRAMELLDLADEDAIQARLMLQVFRRWQGVKNDEH